MSPLRSLLLGVTALLPVAAPGQVAPVSMRVEQVSGMDSTKDKHDQRRSLKVHLTNGSAADVTDLKIKYYWFARDVKDREVALLKDGETKADVKARKTELVETGSVTSSYTDDSFASNKGGKGGGNSGGNRSGKKVEGIGKKITGFGVQLFAGDKMIAETFDPPSNKALVGGPSKGPGARP